MPTILDKIVATKREEIVAAKQAVSQAVLETKLDAAPQIRDFFAALDRGDDIKLIAEVKKASPSKGVIREDFDPIEIAKTYAKHGATCLSVLTDKPYFQGDLAYLREIRQHVDVPLLRKDFLLDPYQVVEARANGADAVLLIAECLPGDELPQLLAKVRELGMTALVELYEPENLSRVIDSGARLIGVNNRDLRTFEVDLNHTVNMRQQMPSDRLVVGESGIHTRTDVEKLAAAGVGAILVGESLMRSDDIGAAVKTLLGT